MPQLQNVNLQKGKWLEFQLKIFVKNLKGWEFQSEIEKFRIRNFSLWLNYLGLEFRAAN